MGKDKDKKEDKYKKKDRRNFFKVLAGIWGYIWGSNLSSLLGTGSIGSACADKNNDSLKSFSCALQGKVVIVKNPKVVLSDRKLDRSLIEKMLNDAMRQLVDKENPEDAWKELFNSKDKVTIKINALAGKNLSPHIELIEAIVKGLKYAQVKEENIIVWDRSNLELERAGYNINRGMSGFKFFGTDEPGFGYEEDIEFAKEVGSCFSKILSKHCTALINVPVLKDHDLSGVCVSMKNLYGVIHNPNKYHDNNCTPYVADLSTHPYIKDRLRLVICDAIRGQYNGGPSYKPQWTWDYSGLLLSRDPVALDRIAYDIIDKKRKEAGLPTLKEVGREPKWLKVAASYKLGIEDIEKIKVIEV